MKKFLFLLAFLPLLASAQAPSITGCLGLTFGMFKHEAIHQLASKIDTTGLTIFDKETKINVSNVHFANNFFDHLFLNFYKGKLYEIDFVAKFMDGYKMVPVFLDIMSLYKKKYHKPFYENDTNIIWKDILHHSSMSIMCDISMKEIFVTYEDDKIDKQVSLEKEKDL
jgi:hypothetical protein